MRNDHNTLFGLLVSFILCGTAQGVEYKFTASLSGAAEFPPVASPGTGSATVTVDSMAHTLQVYFTFSDLIGTTTASHIHAPTALPGEGNAGVATQVPFFAGFPIGVTSGSYTHTFDLTDPSSFNPAFVTAQGGTAAGAEAALLDAMLNGKAYLNIHTSFKPGGEIRGFLNIPDAGFTFALLSLGLAALGTTRRFLASLSR